MAPAARPAGLGGRLGTVFALPPTRIAVAAMAMIVFVVALIGYQRYSEERELALYIQESMEFLADFTANGADVTADLYGTGNFL